MIKSTKLIENKCVKNFDKTITVDESIHKNTSITLYDYRKYEFAVQIFK